MATCGIKQIAEGDDIDRIIRDDILTEFCDDFILIDKQETYMPRYYEKFADTIKNFEVRDSDIMVSSFPKAGTTWTQEMVWLIANDLDYEGAKVNLGLRFPYLEICTLFDFEKLDNVLGLKSPQCKRDSIEHIKRQKSPRFIKTHLPFSFLPDEIQKGSKSPKIIYVIRNPKDVCVSFYHHVKILQGWRTNLDSFSKVFMSNKMPGGTFWKHVLGYWERRSSPNLLIITYEDMKKDLPSVIKQVANFLDKNLTEVQIEKLCKHLSFESMKNNDAVNLEYLINLRKKKNLVLEDGSFLRSGTVGKYKEEMSPEIVENFDVWIKENIADTSFGQQYNYNL